ncbi:MAG: glycosyltransferase family A protein [Bacteroidetes bacterium]|nr:glycosyltransferase family A protein [Bacteroidota bacterium]
MLDTVCFSVVIPYFKKIKYIKKTLLSVLNQSYKNFEIVLVIDGTQPEEEDPGNILELLNTDKIKVLRYDQNKGLCGARNYGAGQSNFDWMVFLDADDLLPFNALEVFSSAITASESNVSFYFGDLVCYGKDRKTVIYPNRPFEFEEMLKGNHLSAAGFCISKKSFKEIGGFDENEIMKMSFEDQEFWIRVGVAGLVGVYIPQVLYVYSREDPNSLVAKLGGVIDKSAEYIAEKHKVYFDEFGLYNYFLVKNYKKYAWDNIYKKDFAEARRACWRILKLVPSENETIKILKQIRKKTIWRKIKSILQF